MSHDAILSFVSYLSTAILAVALIRIFRNSRKDHIERRLLEREKERIHDAAEAFRIRDSKRLVEIFHEMETETGKTAVQSFISILTK